MLTSDAAGEAGIACYGHQSNWTSAPHRWVPSGALMLRFRVFAAGDRYVSERSPGRPIELSPLQGREASDQTTARASSDAALSIQSSHVAMADVVAETHLPGPEPP